ncbi:SOUL family heme-binding protein [Sphingomonas crocodyli]|uniref:Heme-binding protein n=1 Tax=Sphingomonas crocodyli TaxID=1979270 RepID=A0A437M6Q9_9SPHN|nr:heme-binding protein [Sphingomonas crocodyli]RVT93398.1 heme-binding protein [Sphingomonas crocodyli]
MAEAKKFGWGKWVAGAVAVAAGGAAYLYLKERQAKAPRFELLAGEGAFELRRYPAMLAIETIQHGSRDRALGNGFGLLADYMFGGARADKDQDDEIPIAMPILAEPASGGSWRIRFLLPEGMARKDVPEPGEGIAIVEIPAREMAAVKVSGKPNDKLFADKAAELLRWVSAKARTAAGDVEHAYYNSPLKPGTVKQNEILVGLSL